MSSIDVNFNIKASVFSVNFLTDVFKSSSSPLCWWKDEVKDQLL